jgi:broad specificity phosphatase PhoE
VIVILTCVRHGQTAWNRARRFQGHTDVPLDDTGRLEAGRAADRLRAERIDRIVASDLERAAETARIIATGRKLAVETDPAWREKAFGAWEGLTWDEITSAGPMAAVQHDPPGGETFEALCARVDAALALLVAAVQPDASVLLVAHAGTIHALMHVVGISALGKTGTVFAPASISRFALEDGRWRCVALNTSEGPIAGGVPDFAVRADNAEA